MDKVKAVAVLCDKRTGSTFLIDALNSHPEIDAFGELFMVRTRAKKSMGQPLFKTMKQEKKWSKRKYLKKLIHHKDKVIVFKLIYGQCDKWNLLPLLKKENVAVIHLVRSDLLARSISKFAKNIIEPAKLNVDPQELLEDAMASKERARKFKKAIRKHNSIKLVYESMIGEVSGKRKNIAKRGAFNITSDQVTYVSDPIAKRLCNFLGIENLPLYSNVTKKNAWSKWDYISDKAEVMRIFKEKGIKI